MALALPPTSSVDLHTADLIGLIASGAPFSRALDAVGELLEARFENAAALVFTLDEESTQLQPNAESLAWMSNTQIPSGPAGGVIGRAITERRPLSGPTSSIKQLNNVFTIRSRSRCVAAPTMDGNGQVIGVIALLIGSDHSAQHVLGVLEVSAKLAAMSASTLRSQQSPGQGGDAEHGLTGSSEFWNLAESKVHSSQATQSPIGLLLVNLQCPALTNSLIAGATALINSSIRPNDVIGYFGSGNFGVLAADIFDVSALQLLSKQISDRLGSSPLPITPRLAGAYAEQNADLSELRKSADNGLLEVRENDVAITETPGSILAAGPDAALLQMLRADSIIPYFQPQIDLDTNRVVGVEALARTIGPNGAESLPQLEILATSKATRALTSRMLSRVCADVAEWETHLAADFKISVNATAEELCETEFLTTVRESLQTFGVAPERLCIEVTESESMSNQRSATEVLEKLREMGLSVAVDDFGTGYSSLAYIGRLPIDLIKIDRAFVSELPSDRASIAIIGAVVDVAKAIGMEVLAEGVETQEQAHCLKEIGVGSAQGWLYSPAISAEDLLTLLHAESL